MGAWKYKIYFSCSTLEIHGCLEIQDLFLVFNTRNKSGISAHPCIILYIAHVLYALHALRARPNIVFFRYHATEDDIDISSVKIINILASL